MKKCSKCGKTYDDTWKVCLSCSIPLADNISIREANPELRKKSENPKKVTWALRGLILILFAGALFLGGSLNSYAKNDYSLQTSLILAIIGCAMLVRAYLLK